jgi:hypothetical protein
MRASRQTMGHASMMGGSHGGFGSGMAMGGFHGK